MPTWRRILAVGASAWNTPDRSVKRSCAHGDRPRKAEPACWNSLPARRPRSRKATVRDRKRRVAVGIRSGFILPDSWAAVGIRYVHCYGRCRPKQCTSWARLQCRVCGVETGRGSGPTFPIWLTEPPGCGGARYACVSRDRASLLLNSGPPRKGRPLRLSQIVEDQQHS